MKKRTKTALLAAATLTVQPVAYADEGMWTLDNLPAAHLKERYGFSPSASWLEHVRLSSVRFNDGGSGAFVSPDGLVLTNHHVALGQLQKVSSQKADYVKDGFFARYKDEEMKCPDLELNVLVSMEDVTARVLKAVDPKAADKDRNDQRKAEMARVEKESADKTGLRSDVVELYQGGEYWLYRYKKYVDVRLVMAPEAQAAFYGGDPDNFTFPRYDLDFAFFRAYEDGKPAKTAHWLKWSAKGAAADELVFVSGHPGSTDRLKTIRQLAHERDHGLPGYLELLDRRRRALYAYSARGPEETRRAKEMVFGIENSIKAISGEHQGLRDPKLFAGLESRESDLRRRVKKDAKLQKELGGAWDRIAAAQAALEKRHPQMVYRSLMPSRLASLAGTIVRYVAEVEKPNEKRLEEFRASALESLDHRLFSPAPIYKDLETAMLSDALAFSLEKLGPKDAHVKAALGGQTPATAAARLISGTKLDDPEFRRALIKGGRKAVEASADPMIVWARGLDASYRELRKWHEDTIESVEAIEGNKIARARFSIYGKSAYPDATFTLRLSFGRVAGYEQGTTKVPYKTTFWGLYDRAASFDGKPPFDLPAKLAAAKDKLDLDTPLNFVTTNDIIGGNSGSPVFNRDAEYVGLIFDGNIQSLVGRYAYGDEQSRAVAVHSSAILESLRKVYAMGPLADELVAR